MEIEESKIGGAGKNQPSIMHLIKFICTSLGVVSDKAER